jgi:hypothetical protein
MNNFEVEAKYDLNFRISLQQFGGRKIKGAEYHGSQDYPGVPDVKETIKPYKESGISNENECLSWIKLNVNTND